MNKSDIKVGDLVFCDHWNENPGIHNYCGEVIRVNHLSTAPYSVRQNDYYQDYINYRYATKVIWKTEE